MRKKKAQKAVSKPRARRTNSALQAAEPVAAGPFTAEERATLAFFSVEGVGPVTLVRIRAEFGTLAEALRQPAQAIAPFLNNDRTREQFLQVQDPGSLADQILERAEKANAKVIFQGRPEWPRQLDGLGFPPLLYVRGQIDPDARRVAIVGSRETDRYGLQLASFFASVLSEHGVGIVSGGARGIDGAAHTAAVSEPGATIAVLGSGVDVVYPKEHELLFQRIADLGGAVVSHFPPGTPAVAQNFKVRNRIIAALSDVTLVARAGAESGSLGTAMAAIELRRPVFAVPGDVTNPLAAGVNSLLENALARACTGLPPVAGALGMEGDDWPTLSAPGGKRNPVVVRSHAPPPRLATPQQRAEVPQELRPVWEALGKRPVQFDELSGVTGMDAAALANALVRLELLGLCEERAGKVFART
ncbi:MAG TPA: DNA-processing protein DprA [Myxococcales bacterium]|jgi:DNA processing protein